MTCARCRRYLAFLTKDGSGAEAQLIDPLNNVDNPDAAAPFADDMRPLCDRKAVPLSAAQNAAANFFVMTDVPIVANGSGLVNNDLANAFDPNAPTFGEKYSPPYVPIGFYDWNGNLVNRVYSDQFGRYNAVLPSTYSVNLPMPSGVSPNMLQTCINDAGPIANPEFVTNPDAPATIIDPLFDPRLTQACYTLQFMPGTITYLDTPVLPIAAFTVPPTFPPDCEREDRTPMIASVNRRNNSGGGGPFALAGQQIRISSMGGAVEVPNPDWDGADTTPRTTTRNYNFGGTDNPGTVELEDAAGNRTALNIVAWSGTKIDASIPVDTAPGEYEVIVTRIGGVPPPGVESPLGVTLTVGVNVGGTERGVRPNGDYYSVHAVGDGGFASIQDAIDSPTVAPGDLILVGPGTYNEQLILWKPVKLQGWGAGAVILSARQIPTESLNAWRTKTQELVTNNNITPLPGQAAPWFTSEEGAGIFVAGLDGVVGESFSDLANRGARIDGLTILGAGSGGGIVLNGYASYMNIGNNRIESNSGVYGGGVRLGHPTLTHDDGGVLVYDDADNDFVRIHHNHIAMNGGTSDLGVGGAISLNTGATGYRVQKNWACGNFTQGSGAGIGHRGFSDNGLIEDNAIVFNESFSQDSPQHGGGIFIGGQPALQAVDGILVSPGSGTVTVDANLIRGNLAGAGDGGGIRIQSVNGEDVLAGLDDSGPWDDVLVLNNMITNNVAGLAGGGVSIQDAVSVGIWHNTIANNDSVSTTFQAGTPGNTLVNSDPHPAGIVSHAHGLDFGLLMADADAAASVPGNWLTFSDPALVSNIVSQNRSWFWLNANDPATAGTEAGILIPENCHPAYCDPAGELVEDYSWDLEVLPEGTGLLSPRRSLLTDSVRNSGYIGSFGNITGDPAFVLGYLNGPRDAVNFPAGVTPQTAGAFDEGGNFIQVTYGPLTLDGYDYHITASSIAINAGTLNVWNILSLDFDNDARPSGVRADIGADERP